MIMALNYCPGIFKEELTTTMEKLRAAGLWVKISSGTFPTHSKVVAT
jgi:hypothetical protein